MGEWVKSYMDRPAQAHCNNCEDEDAECILCGNEIDDDSEVYCNGADHICENCFGELQGLMPNKKVRK
jgi:hypothetical protein